MLLRILFSACAAAVVAGCGDASRGSIIDDSCFMDPAPITVRTQTLQVGDTVTFSARLGEPRGCLPRGLSPVAWRWESRDTAVMRIDPVSGLAIASQPGTTLITVRHLQDAEVTSSVELTVLGGGDR